MRLQSEISVFKFLHRIVNGVLVLTHVFISKEGEKVPRKLEEKKNLLFDVSHKTIRKPE